MITESNDGALAGISEAAAAGAEEGLQVVPKRIAGLLGGRIVNYVMGNDEVRPLIVVNPFDSTGILNGVLLFDGRSDLGKFPVALGSVNVADLHENQLCTLFVQGVAFDDEGAPGTWHWPSRQPVVAAGLDASVLETFREELLATMNQKLQSTVESVNNALDSHAELVRSAISEVKTPVVVNAGGTLPTMAVPPISSLQRDPEVVSGAEKAQGQESQKGDSSSQV